MVRTSKARSIAVIAVIAVGATLAFAAARPCIAQSEGFLDTRFYSDGKFTLDAVSESEEFTALVVAPDGQIAAAGFRQPPGGGDRSLFWSRFDGTTAPSTCAVALPGSPEDIAPTDAIFDSQGRLLVAAQAHDTGGPLTAVVLRFLYPACELDESFDTDGLFAAPYADHAYANALGIDSQGRLLVAGRVRVSSTYRIFVLRLTGAGALDASFDGDGHAEISIGAVATLGNVAAMAVQPDDRMVVAGWAFTTDEVMFAARIDLLGDLDGTFSGDGIQIIDFPSTTADYGTDVALEPVSGKVVVSGTSYQDDGGATMSVARLRPTGSFDSDFGDGGRWISDVFWWEESYALEIQSDGRIVVAGRGIDSEGFSATVAFRILPQGEIDSSFGFFGACFVTFAEGESSWAEAATLQGGELVMAGRTVPPGADPEISATISRMWARLVFVDGFERGNPGGWSGTVP